MPLFSKKTSSALVAKQTQSPPPPNPNKNHALTTNKIPYSPIDSANREIRLLVVSPGTEGDRVRCRIQHTFLGSKNQIPYETISYCWGHNPPKADIEINGVAVTVPMPAAKVIRRVRYAKRERVIWIDAICINQRELGERSAQVALMGEIYRRTWRGVVWLGEDGGSGKAVGKVIEQLGVNIKHAAGSGRRLWEMTRDPSGPSMPRVGDALDSRIDLRPLMSLYSSPWFGRLWIVQEAALPPQSICYFGPETYQLLDILRAALWLNHNHKRIPPQLARCPGLYKAGHLCDIVDRDSIPPQQLRSITVDLSMLYRMFIFMECGNPVDKIYGLLGLYDSVRLPRVIPDYKLPKETVFRDVTRRMIEQSGELAMLEYVDTRENSLLSSPSWAVDFGARLEDRPHPLGQFFAAAGGLPLSRSTLPSSKESNALCLVGRAIDTVSCRASCMGDMYTENAWKVLQDVYRVIRRKQPAGFSDNRLGSTLMAGRNWYGQAVWSQDLEHWSAFFKYTQKYRRSPLPAEHFDQFRGKFDNETLMAGRCFSAIVKACTRRRFFVTKGSLLGLGPHGLRDGDLLAILYGSQVPFALRSAGNGRYQLIGACFVDGIMGGEAVRSQNAQKQKDVEFWLI